MTIIVEVKNEILGNSEFWRGDESRIAEIRNIPARETAKQVVADGKPRVCGMWHVRQELTPNTEYAGTAYPAHLIPPPIQRGIFYCRGDYGEGLMSGTMLDAAIDAAMSKESKR